MLFVYNFKHRVHAALVQSCSDGITKTHLKNGNSKKIQNHLKVMHVVKYTNNRLRERLKGIKEKPYRKSMMKIERDAAEYTR